jgi:hypothetical protein
MKAGTKAAWRLANDFTAGADRCRRLAETVVDPDSRSIYEDLAASYERMAVCVALRWRMAAERPRTIFLRRRT